MKIRKLKRILDSVVHVCIYTEDWSENDRSLMVKFGEPEISLGGTFSSDTTSVTLDDVHARILTEVPFTRKFDARDLGSIADAKLVANAWGDAVENRIISEVDTLRSKDNFFTTEEITEH